MQLANVFHLWIGQRDLKVLMDGLEQVVQRHGRAVINDDGTPQCGHVADVARHDDLGRVGVGDGVGPDAGHVDDDVVGCQTFRRGGVLRHVPVDQG